MIENVTQSKEKGKNENLAESYNQKGEEEKKSLPQTKIYFFINSNLSIGVPQKKKKKKEKQKSGP